MTKEQTELLKNTKLMVVDKKLAQEIEDLSKKMKRPAIDVLWAAVKLMEKSLGRRVTLRKPGSDISIEYPMFEKYEPEVKLEGE